VPGTPGDEIIFAYAGNDLSVGLDGNDQIFGGAGNDTLDGSNGNDTLDGETGNDTIFGNAGNDLLLGSVGDDLLYGMNGNDLLYGEAGNDTLSGGAGQDIFTSFTSDGDDLITDFNVNQDFFQLLVTNNLIDNLQTEVTQGNSGAVLSWSFSGGVSSETGSLTFQNVTTEQLNNVLFTRDDLIQSAQ